MMADTLEAASRSLQNPTKEKLEELIRKLVRGKMDDGQLDECPITMRDIALCCEAFLTSLSGAYHQRIEYPDVKIPQRPIIESAPAPAPVEAAPAPAEAAPAAEPAAQSEGTENNK